MEITWLAKQKERRKCLLQGKDKRRHNGRKKITRTGSEERNRRKQAHLANSQQTVKQKEFLGYLDDILSSWPTDSVLG